MACGGGGDSASPTWEGRFLDSRPVSGYGTCFRGNDGLRKGLHVERGWSACSRRSEWRWMAAQAARMGPGGGHEQPWIAAYAAMTSTWALWIAAQRETYACQGPRGASDGCAAELSLPDDRSAAGRSSRLRRSSRPADAAARCLSGQRYPLHPRLRHQSALYAVALYALHRADAARSWGPHQRD